MPKPSKALSAAPSARNWLLALILLLALIPVYEIYVSKSMVTDHAYLVGENFVYALVLFACLYFGLGKGLGFGRNFLAFVVIYGVMNVSAFVRADRVYAESKAAFQRIKSSAQDSIDAVMKNDGKPVAIPAQVAAPSTASGDVAVAENLVKGFVKTSLNLHNEYVAAVDATGWNRMLSAQRLANDSGLVESKEMLAKVSQTVQQYRVKNVKLIGDMRNAISASSLDAGMKQQMLNGFDASRTRSEADMNQLWDLEQQQVNEIAGIVAMLEEHKGRWQTKNDQILFMDQSDLDKFQQHIANVKESMEKQNKMRADVNARRQATLENVSR